MYQYASPSIPESELLGPSIPPEKLTLLDALLKLLLGQKVVVAAIDLALTR